MAEVILVVMAVSAALYTVLGGADFGAGMLEVFLGARERERVDVALLPVWEANHVWLVLLATLAFVSFPEAFSLVSTHLHIPILLILLGVVARGSAFTFRHYDPAAGALDVGYTWVFRVSSALTPLFLGISAAALVQGRIDPDARGFYEAYVAPWNTWFTWSTGLFVCALFTFEGAALLAAEHARSHAPLPYLRLARRAHLAAITLGVLVLVAAYATKVAWLFELLASPVCIGSIALATLLIPVVAYAFGQGRPWLLRLSMGAQVSSILVAFFAASFPVLVRTAHGGLRYQDVAAPAASLAGVCLALAVGLLLIVPSLVYLLRVFKVQRAADPT